MGETTKIVPRQVYDDIVRDRMQGDSTDFQEYLERVPVYQKNVVTALPRIELSRSAAGLVKKNADCTFKAVLQQLMNNVDGQSPCELKWEIEEGRVLGYKTDVRTIKVLKALAIAQLSSSREYSDTMAYIFQQLSKSVVTGKTECRWEPDINFTAVQEVVFDSTTKYITKFLGM